MKMVEICNLWLLGTAVLSGLCIFYMPQYIRLVHGKKKAIICSVFLYLFIFVLCLFSMFAK